MSVRAAAQRLGIGYSTLKRWIRAGVVRTTQTAGGHHRIAEAEVERLSLKRGAVAVPAARTRVSDDFTLGELSARNRLPGFVEEVRIDGLLAQVRMRVGEHSLTAVITADAARALRLRRGGDAIAVVKSTEVMIAARASSPRTRRGSKS